MATLYTLGYQGLDVAAYVARLSDFDVRLIVDVREVPQSRKRGFSKHVFAEHLHSARIQYVHIKELGCPKRIRAQYKVDGDWRAYTHAFAAYLKTQEAAVSNLARAAALTSACLVCFEADHNFCHRSFVAEAARRAGGPPIFHLGATATLPDVRSRVAA